MIAHATLIALSSAAAEASSALRGAGAVCGVSAGAVGGIRAGIGRVFSAGLAWRARAQSAAVGRWSGSEAVIAVSRFARSGGRCAGTAGERCRRATAASTSLPVYSQWPVRHSSRTRPRA
ncbi:hypothetical protein LZG04_11580 [Saccharothrix sp. S26]|nr:hypothetical protein [Saccharothrix sp. S26]MCE6995442.1 hypothetical protein [Saccharothrix sp. S26]